MNCLCMPLYSYCILLLLLMMDLQLVLIDLCISCLYWLLSLLSYATVYHSVQTLLLLPLSSPYLSSLRTLQCPADMTSVLCWNVCCKLFSVIISIVSLVHVFSFWSSFMHGGWYGLFLTLCVYCHHLLCYDSGPYHSFYLHLTSWTPGFHVLLSK